MNRKREEIPYIKLSKDTSLKLHDFQYRMYLCNLANKFKPLRYMTPEERNALTVYNTNIDTKPTQEELNKYP